MLSCLTKSKLNPTSLLLFWLFISFNLLQFSSSFSFFVSWFNDSILFLFSSLLILELAIFVWSFDSDGGKENCLSFELCLFSTGISFWIFSLSWFIFCSLILLLLLWLFCDRTLNISINCSFVVLIFVLFFLLSVVFESKFRKLLVLLSPLLLVPKLNKSLLALLVSFLMLLSLLLIIPNPKTSSLLMLLLLF